MKWAGAHRIPLDTSADGIELGLRSRGWKVVRIDGGRATTKQALLQEFSSVLELPTWFGENWDALVDVLRTRAAATSGGLAIVIDHGEHLGAMVDTLVDIVNDLAAEGVPLGLHVRRRPAFFRSVP